MKVGNCYQRAIITAEARDSLADTMSRMRLHGSVRSLPVTSGGHLVGLITEPDFLRAMVGGADPRLARVDGYMTRGPVAVSPSTDVYDAAALMAKFRVTHLPVVDGGKIVGIVSAHDLVFAQLDMPVPSMPRRDAPAYLR